jgi:hypothetical protein
MYRYLTLTRGPNRQYFIISLKNKILFSMMVNYIVKEKVIFIIYYFTTFLNFYSLGAKKLEILTLNSLNRCIVLHPGPAFRGAGPQLFSVKPAVCCVYLNSR